MEDRRLARELQLQAVHQLEASPSGGVRARLDPENSWKELIHCRSAMCRAVHSCTVSQIPHLVNLEAHPTCFDRV